MQRLFCTIILWLVAVVPQAQDLAGVWKGRLSQEPGGCFPEYFLELNIVQKNGQLSGISYDYYDTSIYIKQNFTGSFQPSAQKLMLRDIGIIRFKIPPHCVPCIKTYYLTYKREGNEDFLVGNWTGFDSYDSSRCPPGKIVLKRIPESAFKFDSVDGVRPTLQTLPEPDPAVFRNRVNELVQTIKVDTPIIKIKLYDNAEIDDDTISVLFNKQIVLSKKRLTSRALELDLQIPARNVSYELVMIAENLGKIPPNTALMVVHVRDKRYELRVSSTDKKNAMVRFLYE